MRLQLIIALATLSYVTSEAPWRPERIAILAVESFGRIDLTTHAWEPWNYHNRFHDLSHWCKATYAARHGYDLHFVSSPPNISITNMNQIQWQRAFWTRRQFGSKAPPNEPAADKEAASCQRYDIIVWLDSDLFITNYTVRIPDIMEAARRLRPDGTYPTFVASKNADSDNSSTFNTGTAIVRCSDEGLRLMNLMLRIRVEQAHNSYVRLWDHQGALISAYETHQWVRDITTFVPPKLINSYPYKLAEETGEIRDCGVPNGAECQKGYWTPGDWLIHFPGGGKPYARTFLDRYPPHTWPGATDPTNW